jgi:hypothetical protein
MTKLLNRFVADIVLTAALCGLLIAVRSQVLKGQCPNIDCFPNESQSEAYCGTNVNNLCSYSTVYEGYVIQDCGNCYGYICYFGYDDMMGFCEGPICNFDQQFCA